MAFQLSPGVLVREIDLTQVVPAVATSPGAFAGAFQWGPVDEVINISSENELVSVFGEPNADTYEYFFTAANFLSYGSNLQVVRAETGNTNATEDGSGFLIKNNAHYDALGASAVASGVGDWAAKYPGILGNSLRVSVCQNANAYTQANVTTCATANIVGATAITLSDSSAIGVGDLIVFNGHNTEYEVTDNTANVVTIKEKGQTTGLTNAVDGTVTPVNVTVKWFYHAEFDNAPGTSAQATARGGAGDEIHVIVIDQDGDITGQQNTVLEKYSNLSVAIDAKKSDGTVNYYKEHINQYSRYLWWGDHYATFDADVGNTSLGLLSNSFSHTDRIPQYVSLTGGTDDNAVTDGELQTAYAHFANDELYDVSLIPVGPASGTTAKWVVDNVAEIRKDCMVFLSPLLADATALDPATDIVDFRQNGANINSSYAVLDSGWKYQYDRYSDVYRWIPLNGDVAGCCVRTDLVADPFFSPAGFARGQIKNAVKVAFSPDKADRDTLYTRQINPVVAFPGQGVTLFGDKTMLTTPSAFDRINVRRLFIVLEKAIATAAKFQLFEFNDTFTRANFRNLVEPFLRDIQGRRGIYDFKVVCDETNNTPTVIDANEFRADIFIKPARSINFITLTFVATRTGISFEETGV